MELEAMVFFSLLLIFTSFFVNKVIEKHAEKQFYDYKIQKWKVHKPSNRKKDEENEDTDFEDFEESLPPWLEGVLEGAGIDLEKFYDGDEKEIAKIKTAIDKLPDGGPGRFIG